MAQRSYVFKYISEGDYSDTSREAMGWVSGTEFNLADHLRRDGSATANGKDDSTVNKG